VLLAVISFAVVLLATGMFLREYRLRNVSIDLDRLAITL
jgi:hypothetical protein